MREDDGLNPIRDALIVATLPNVVFDGWSARALKDGARDAGVSDFDAARAFPGGPQDAVDHFADWADRQMLAALADMDLPTMKVRQRVHAAVKARLMALDSHRDAVRRAIAFSALPAHCGLGPTTLYRTVDAIWLACGDTATDFNFYTKRALLAGVVATTTLYWLEDASEECVESWAFLDRRIGDALGVGRAMGGFGATFAKVSGVLSHLPNPARFARRLKEAGLAAPTMRNPNATPADHPSA